MTATVIANYCAACLRNIADSIDDIESEEG